MDPGGAQQEFPGTRDARSPDWHWNPRGTTYHFPIILVDYDLEGMVDLAVKRAPLLGEFWSAPIANQFMDRLLRLTWYDICTQDHGVINTLWQEFVEGGGISKPPDGALYGVGILHFYVGHRGRRGAIQG